MNKTAFKISLTAFALSIIVVSNYHYKQAIRHDVMAFDFLQDYFFYGIALMLFAAAVIFLFKSKSSIKTWVLSAYVTLIVASFVLYNYATQENDAELILQASTGDVVGGLCLKFRADSTFRIENYGGIGYDWQEGKYIFEGDKIELSYDDKHKVADIGKEILWEGETLYYMTNEGDTSRLLPMHIVFKKLNKK